MSKEYNDLVGPRADEQESKIIEDINAAGQPIYLAFLKDPEALRVTADEIQDAKNAFKEMQEKSPEVISMCKHKTLDECRELVYPSQAA